MPYPTYEEMINDYRYVTSSEGEVVANSNFATFLGGLMIAQDSAKWYVSVIDGIGGHNLDITIVAFEDGNYSQYPIPLPNGPNRHIRIDIPSVAPRTPGRFTSTGENDPRHIKWMGDFNSDELYGRAITVRRPIAYKLTKVELNAGMGFTGRLAFGDDHDPDLYRFDKATNQDRILGHWLGIANSCPEGSELEISLNGVKYPVPERYSKFESGKLLYLFVDNVCDNPSCDNRNDFHYYFRPRGMVREAMIPLIHVSPLLPTKKKDEQWRIACNAMLASEISGSNSLFDEQELENELD